MRNLVLSSPTRGGEKRNRSQTCYIHHRGFRFGQIPVFYGSLSLGRNQGPVPPSLPPSTPVYANPAPPLISPYSPAPVTQSASAPPAQDSLPALEEDSGSPSSQTEMFPLSGPEAVPPGYAPALLARLSVDSETGEVRIYLTPAHTITPIDWLFVLGGEPLSSLLGQIRNKAARQGISISEDTPFTIVNSYLLPPPFAGKSLEELNQLVLPASPFRGNYTSPFGSVPWTGDADQFWADAFALIDDYVIDLGEVT